MAKGWKYFTEDELKCSHTNECAMDEEFMAVLESIREECDFPFRISSAYRSPSHPVEAKKSSPGAHASGKAVDILVNMDKAYILIEVAYKHGVPRIGISQKGDMGSRFIHLDWDTNKSSPRVWSY